jgi:NADPH-dependent curcumin reductase CurA
LSPLSSGAGGVHAASVSAPKRHSCDRLIRPGETAYAGSKLGIMERRMARLDGKIAIITGATSGIGRRPAEIFTSEGARVVTCGRRRQLGHALEEALGRDRCIFVVADVTKEADVQSVVADLEVGS